MLNPTEQFGKTLMFVGILIVIVGVLIFFSGKIPHAGKLPGDILIKKKNFTFYFPITTSILISILLSILLTLFLRR